VVDAIVEEAEAFGAHRIAPTTARRLRTHLLLGGAWLMLSGCPKDQVLRPDDAGSGPDAGDASPSDAGNADGGQNDAGRHPDAGSDGGNPDGGQNDAGGSPEGGSEAGVVGPGTPSNPECDLNGYWVGRQTTISSALSIDQFASNWYLMRMQHDGDDVEIVEHLDCGIYVHSTVIEVNLPRDTMVTLATKNPQTGRKATAKLSSDGDTCEVSFQRFYSVRGASPATYLPMGPLDSRDLAPLKADAPLPSQDDETGAEDWNGAGHAGTGVAWVVSGIASGTRWTVQRDWTEWRTDAQHSVVPATPLDSLVLATRFANEENVLRNEGGPLLAMLSTPITDDPRAQVELMRLGSTREEAASILDIDDLGDRCLAVQQLLPHVEPSP